MMLRATLPSPTPLTLEAVAAVLLVAAVVVLLAGMFYLVLAGSVAWALMLLQGLAWLVFQALRRSWTTLRRHVRKVTPSAAEIAAETAPDIRLRPSH